MVSAFSRSDYLSDMACARISRIAERMMTMMSLEQAIEHAEEVAIEQEVLMGRYDAASGYARSGNESIRTESAKECEKCAAEHRQLAAWLRELQERRKAPEIIRCGECRHYKPMSSNWGNCYVHGSPTELHRTCQSCDYCSWAERRTDEVRTP